MVPQDTSSWLEVGVLYKSLKETPRTKCQQLLLYRLTI